MLFGKRGERRNLNLGSGANNVQLVMQNGQLVPIASGVNATAAIQNSDVYSVVNLIASDVASLPFETSIADQNLMNLLTVNPSPLYSSYSFWQTVYCNLLLNGNSFVAIWRDPMTNRPTKLELLINMEVNVLMSDDSQHLQYDIRFFDDRPDTIVDSQDILHFRLLPANTTTQLMVLGTSPLMSLANEVEIQNNTNNLTLTSLVKSINPSGILTINKGLLDHQAKENVRTEFEAANSGANAGRPLVLDQSTTYKSVAIDANVLNLLKGTDWTRQQICKAFGVPSDLLQMESEHSNISQIMTFYAACLNRYINPITSEIQNKLVTLPGEKVTMDSSPITDPDNSLFENRMANLVKNGVITSDMALTILQKKGGW